MESAVRHVLILALAATLFLAAPARAHIPPGCEQPSTPAVSAVSICERIVERLNLRTGVWWVESGTGWLVRLTRIDCTNPNGRAVEGVRARDGARLTLTPDQWTRILTPLSR